MERNPINSDVFLRELGGCGSFQVVFCILVYVVYAPWSFSLLLMSFGAYNPGWRCLDNSTYTTLNQTANQSFGYQLDSCHGFDRCHHVQFNPEASTIVTEFGLVCDQSWLISFIMTFQMVGALVGAMLVGFLGDKFGRRTTLYSFLLLNVALHLVCMFSVSVEMFITLRFFIGICGSVMGYLPITFITEFMPPKWRIVIASIPGWPVGNILFSLSAMLTKDWAQMHLIIAILSLVCFCSVFWVPESLRWLAVNGKEKECLSLSKKIARMNGGTLNHEHCRELIQMETANKSKVKEYGILDLFRKGYRVYPLSLGLPFLLIDMYYFTLAFGVSMLPGNLYFTLFIMAAIELPGNVIAAFVPNKFGRKLTSSVGLFLLCLCLFAAAVVELTVSGPGKDIAVLALLLCSKIPGAMSWYVLNVFIVELYPTVIRSTANGYSGFMGVMGSIISPYLIPSQANKFYISYLILAIIAFVSSGLILLLPETKGKPLPDTWKTKRGEKIEKEIRT